MKSTIRKIWDAATAVLVCLVVAFAGLLVGPKLFGLDVYIVLSGSMEPDYPTGSVIYVQETDVESLDYWDVITFRLSEKTVATHRIIELVEEDGQTKFRTKGDANEIHDEMLVTKAQVIGTPVFCVPYIGYAVNYIQRPPGLYTAISVGAVMLLLLLLPDLIFGEEPKKKAQEYPAAEEEKNNDPVDARLEE